MPDDRELSDTRSSGRLLSDQVPGLAAVDELVVSRQSEALDSEDIMVSKPLGILFWLAIGWVTLVVADGRPRQRPPAPQPQLPELLGHQRLPRASTTCWAPTTWDVICSVGWCSGPASPSSSASSRWSSGCWSAAPWASSRATRAAASTWPSTPGSFVILAFPAIVAVIAILAFWGQSLFKITVILSVAVIPLLYRVVRASSLAFANREFVIAARTLGAKSSRIVFREILPNVVPVAVTFGLITVAGVIVIEGSLAFLGLSVPLPTPSWGNMISEGTSNGNLNTNPYIMLWPVLAMFLLLLSINLIGDRLRQRFDIREGLL